MYDILFIQSSADTHLSCFQLLAIVNNSVKIHVQVSVWTYVFQSLEFHLKIELLGHVITVFLNF